jgi:hypothetical protein
METLLAEWGIGALKRLLDANAKDVPPGASSTGGLPVAEVVRLLEHRQRRPTSPNSHEFGYAKRSL